MHDPRFRRNLIFVAALHILLLGTLIYFARRPASHAAGDIVWMDPGSFSQAAIDAGDEEEEETADPTPEPTPPPTPESTPEPTPPPTPDPTPEEETIPLDPTPPPKATPSPTPKPTPTPKPKPKPTPTPKPTPKTTPKPTPKATPKSVASPKKSPKPNGSPKASPRSEKSPKGKELPGSGASPGPTVKAAKVVGSGAAGQGGGGGGSSEFGWYHSLIHDRFYSQWDQPTSIFDSSKSFVCTLQIRIEPNGKIAGVKVVRSSGNVIMDDSVMAAANRVLQIDPPPAALAAGGAYTVNINFELQ
jgi:TonB family protein